MYRTLFANAFLRPGNAVTFPHCDNAINSVGFFFHKSQRKYSTDILFNAPEEPSSDSVKFTQMLPVDTNTYCGVFKVIKAVVCENKPSPFPGFHSSPWNKRAWRWVRGEQRDFFLLGCSKLLLYSLYMSTANYMYTFFYNNSISTYLLRKQAASVEGGNRR